MWLNYKYTVKMEAAPSSETSVNFYWTTWRHISDDGYFYFVCQPPIRASASRIISRFHSAGGLEVLTAATMKITLRSSAEFR
jgi:hypothetical protein